MAVLRLTEVEVHGTDLNIGASEWSEQFVRAALPMRLYWLPVRRSRHVVDDPGLRGTWLFATSDGPSYAVSVTENDVVVTEGSDGDEDARIVGTSSQVLAFLLGRLALSELAVHGSEAFAARYQDAFPPP